MNVLICDTNVNYQGTLFLMKIYFTIFTLTRNKSKFPKRRWNFSIFTLYQGCTMYVHKILLFCYHLYE